MLLGLKLNCMDLPIPNDTNLPIPDNTNLPPISPELNSDLLFISPELNSEIYFESLPNSPIDKEDINKRELIGNCLYFYFVNLLRCVDVILNKIGEGGFGSVYLCCNGKKDYNTLYAVKCIKYSDLINLVDRERRFGYVSKLNSSYLIKYYEIFTFNNDFYAVMEYFKDGNLNDFIKRYREGNKRIEENVYFYFI
jgi:hypothetical protein